MMDSALVKLLGFSATLIHSDTAVLDRFRWLKRHLPPTRDHLELLDAGCGSGAFTLFSAKRGYEALGLSWNKTNQNKGFQRAKICHLNKAKFEVCDIRHLELREDLHEKFDVVISFENIEHIIDDLKLARNLANCLKPGGQLLLTAPNYYYRAFTESHNGPFKKDVEDGGHVRRGYTKLMLEELCGASGLKCNEISFCTGYLSQKISGAYVTLKKLNPLLAWITIFPFRILPPFFDRLITWALNWPYYSICMTAYKPLIIKNTDPGQLR